MRRTLALLMFLGCSFTFRTALAQTLTYGPILGRGVTPDQMIVKWGTGASGDATSVSFRPKGSGSFTAVTGGSSKDHEIVLTGLQLGSSYEYYVTSSGATATYEFATCPQPGMPMDMVFYGDTRAPFLGSTNHPAVFAQITTAAPEMIFQSGDLIPNGDYASYLSDFFPVIKNLARTTPYMSAPGNHDNNSTLSTNFGKVMPAPSAQGVWQPYYAFTCGNAMFISLNSNDVGNATQLSFLTDHLASAKSDATLDHVFVFFHHPPYSDGSHGDDANVQSSWVPLFDDPTSKVTAVFNGHDHAYERFSNGSKVAYIVSGGGGADLYSESNTSSATKVVFQKVYNYVKVHIVGPQAIVTAMDIASPTPIETFTLGTAAVTTDMGVVGQPDGGYAYVDGSSSAGTDGGGKPGTNSSAKGCSFAGQRADTSGLGVFAFALVLLLAHSRRRRANSRLAI